MQMVQIQTLYLFNYVNNSQVPSNIQSYIQTSNVHFPFTGSWTFVNTQTTQLVELYMKNVITNTWNFYTNESDYVALTISEVQ